MEVHSRQVYIPNRSGNSLLLHHRRNIKHGTETLAVLSCLRLFAVSCGCRSVSGGGGESEGGAQRCGGVARGHWWARRGTHTQLLTITDHLPSLPPLSHGLMSTDTASLPNLTGLGLYCL
jgi:hypothetical protein